MHSDALLLDLEVARESGMMVTTPNEAALRADTLLLIGRGLDAAWPDLAKLLIARAPDPNLVQGPRKIYRLCPGSRPETLDAGAALVEIVGRDPKDLTLLLAALRARIAGRPCGKPSVPQKTLDALAAGLTSAHFGVAVWSSSELDPLTIDMLCGVVKDLNATTRFSGLPLAPGDNAAGVLQACAWMTGFPVRTGFARGYPEHDPWRFEARRLVESGESDCVLWISAYRPAGPDWEEDLPTIVLTDRDARFRRPPRVHIAVGRPGLDHDAVEQMAATGTLACVEATKKSETISVARAITQIALALETGRAWPC